VGYDHCRLVLVVLSRALPTRQWTKWDKSEGRLDAAKVDLSGPDPNNGTPRRLGVPIPPQ